MSAIKITLPDNSIRELPKAVSIGEFAAMIGPGLAKSAVAGKIDGALVDIRTILDKNCKLEIVTLQNPESHEVIRHSAAHIMAQAVQEIWPEVKITIGPVIENGFFYDLDSPRNFVPEDLEKIEKAMQKIVEVNHPITKEMVPIAKAIEIFKKMGERFKVEIIEDLKTKGEVEVSLYHQGNWFDLCRGPHVPSTGFLKAFKLLSIAGAYWRGDEKNPMLQRIYGTAFSNKKDLEAYLNQLEEAKKRDHRKLGKELNLFMFHPLAPAMPFFFPKGTVIYNEIMKFIRELYVEHGYEEVITPQIYDVDLYHTSGHYENYRENMYFTQIDEREFSMKPMNCPGHCLMYSAGRRSYRELPWRVADFGRLHRNERAGVVHGLARVRSFSQDDAHIFCRVDQIPDEIVKFISFLNQVYTTLGFDKYQVFFSTRPEKRAGSDKNWDKAENALETGLKNLKIDYKINAGDGAFYGPKLDVMVTDAIGRAWQLGTLQCDFTMPERFKLEYIGEDNKPHIPVMLHRAIVGSFERFLGVYIEHCAGSFPTWVAPVQAVLINITSNQEAYTKEVEQMLRSEGLRVTADLRNEKLGYKIREAQLQKVPYMLIIGDQEVQNRTLSVRLKAGKELKGIAIDEFKTKILTEIKARSLTSIFADV
ncbi:MAG: threonine--tRNA ligase [Oligoflexia bacterium]|nr:threonine--tRNA ligase [Oligoflexia bacterium]